MSSDKSLDGAKEAMLKGWHAVLLQITFRQKPLGSNAEHINRLEIYEQSSDK